MNLTKLKIGVLCMVAPVCALAQNDTFVIKGKINPSHNGEMIYLSYPLGHRIAVRDSSAIANGGFIFTGKIPVPGVSTLKLGKKSRGANMGDFYLANGETNFTASDSLKYAVVGGNKLADDYERLMASLRPISKERANYVRELSVFPADRRKSTEAMVIADKIQAKNKEEIEAIYKFIDENPDSYVSLDHLQKMSASTLIIDYDFYLPKLNKLSERLRNSEAGKAFYARMLTAKATGVGTVAKNFESTTPDGKKLSLKEVEATGKYTLIDFWASWCVPCRNENPNVVSAYNDYHDKGLNILSVSLDSKAENWKAAIVKDGMPWNHVSNLQGWKDTIAEQYDVHAIPQNVLVNSKGVVVAKNLRGYQLQQKLKQLFR